ncbi:alpha-amylase family protein [Glaciecola sp. MH2013]|uniref:alpha-amylase n=1 Tax=Glaciecola sp. MH2013 TaxID=2785524 RepID=UPI00189CD49E|nr:alpha-amylase family protein [Glaciecola sp. MH2013]MBF7071783.1 alpha-amylase family protein [Glaciecola sp. MH2013]
MKLHKLITSVALSASLFSASAVAAPATFVHLFEWNWKDIATECETFLSKNGYAAVQVSPPNEHITNSEWWARYQPVSYVLESRGGTRAEFIDMVQRCDAVGVKIYVDAVINHMAAGSGTGTAGNTFGNKNYPNYSPQDFHTSCPISSYNNRFQVQNCELVGLADLDTDAPYVQDTIAGFLSDLVNIGVAGFRLDASKHMPTGDISAILSKVNGQPLIFQEVIDQGGEAIGAPEYFANGKVTEFKYSVEIGNVFRQGKLAWLSNFGEAWGLMPSYLAVVFVDNHDNQRGHGGGGNVITFEDGRLYDLANVFMLTYPYGYPKVMSSYEYFGNTDAGAPGVNVHNNGNLQCFGNDWKCEHRWSYIAGASKFRDATSDEFVTTNWWDNSSNQIAFGRKDKGFVAINKESFPLNASLQTSMEAGRYCNVLKGELTPDKRSCTGEIITVNGNSRISANVASYDAFAITHNQKIIDDVIVEYERTVIFIEQETAVGQDMFIRGGIDHGFAATLGKNCNASNFECAIRIKHRNERNTTTAPWKLNDKYLDWYGLESGQDSGARGTALDWTIDSWPASWGQIRRVITDGYGEESLNIWGANQWMLDVDMVCDDTYNGFFEIKAFVKNGQGWESDINQANTPYASNNHVAECGKVNRFVFNGNSVEVRDF